MGSQRILRSLQCNMISQSETRSARRRRTRRRNARERRRSSLLPTLSRTFFNIRSSKMAWVTKVFQRKMTSLRRAKMKSLRHNLQLSNSLSLSLALKPQSWSPIYQVHGSRTSRKNSRKRQLWCWSTSSGVHDWYASARLYECLPKQSMLTIS
jgi:hypothetical protein